MESCKSHLKIKLGIQKIVSTTQYALLVLHSVELQPPYPYRFFCFPLNLLCGTVKQPQQHSVKCHPAISSHCSNTARTGATSFNLGAPDRPPSSQRELHTDSFYFAEPTIIEQSTESSEKEDKLAPASMSGLLLRPKLAWIHLCCTGLPTYCLTTVSSFSTEQGS